MYNFLSNLKNNNIILKNKIKIKLSNKNLNYLNLLTYSGFIRSYKIINDKTIEVFLKYNNNKPLIKKIIIFSKPSKRVYVKKNHLYLNTGLYILSTSQGLITHKIAQKYNLGGELICQIC